MAILAALLPLPRFVAYYAGTGDPLAGGFVRVFIPGTSTVRQTWQDAAKLIPNADPIILDASGSCLLYGAGTYELRVTDHLGNMVPGYSGITRATPLDTPVTPQQYGAIGDGIADDGPAFTAALAASREVEVPAGTYRIGTNVVAPNGSVLLFHAGALLSIDTGKTFVVNGLLDAPRDQQIFSGAGSALGMRTVYPEWWGSQVNNAAFDSQPAMVLAHTAVQASFPSDGSRPTIILGAGTYYVANTWTLAPSANIQLAVQGEGSIFGGTRIQTMTGFPAAPVVYVTGQTDATQMIADWELSGFSIENGGGAPTIGLQIGTFADSAHNLIGALQSVIEDVLVDDMGGTKGFPTGIQFCHVRLINLRRVAAWSRVGPTGSAADTRSAIKITQNGGFTGDMTFDNVQYVGSINAAMAGLEISCTSGPTVAADHSIAGLRFNGLVGYSCGRYVNISAQAGSIIHDIWFNPGCQWDGGSINGIFLQSDGAATLLQNIHLQGCFIDGATADQLNIITSNSGLIRDMWVTDNWSSQTLARFVVAGSASGMISGLHVCDNEINNNSNPAGASIFVTGGVTYFRINGNIATRQTGVFMNWLVQLGVGADNFICTENVANGIAATATISDLSGAVTKVVTNNL